MATPSPETIRLRDSLTRAGLTPFQAPIETDEARERARRIVGEMTDDERYDLVVGAGFVIRENARLGLPEIKLFDATAGVHLRDTVASGHLHRTVSFPSFVNLAASWNRALVAQYAHAIGEECRAGGIHVLLGPGVNIYRNAQNGRNFEYAGEDPFLASDVTRIYITALQQTGTMATVKHFIANNTDWCRRLSNSVVGKRALEEIYLPAFRAAVHAGTGAVMTSYNQLNGEYCGESDTVINGLLRERLGFDGMVMTDWTSVTDGELVASSGQDLEMPEGEALQARRETLLGDPRMTAMAERVVTACVRMGFYAPSWRDMPELLERMGEHETVAYRVAAEGIVLLRNEKNALPADVDEGATILVTGNWAVRTPISGKGAAYVKGYNQTSFFEAVNAIAEGVNVIYRETPTDEELEAASLVLVFTGFEDEGEGADRPFELPANQDELIEHAASANAYTVVSLVTGGGVAMPWHDSVDAILFVGFCGQAGANAAADIIFGHTNPSGKLPFTIEHDFADSPAAGYIPEGGRPEMRQPDGEHPLNPGPAEVKTEWPYDVHYREGVYVGYRWYASRPQAVRYWFGHGLSYSTFEYSNLDIMASTPSGDTPGAGDRQPSTAQPAPALDRPEAFVEVRFSVRNLSSVPGAETVQLYVAPPSGVDRPPFELKGFEKLFLAPGESRAVTLYLTPDDFSFFDEAADSWRIAPGTYTILVGASSADIRLTRSFDVGKTD